MAFTINTNFYITSFKEAETKYNETKPIRGKEHMDIRPIGDRRAQHMRILKIDNDTYACRLYNTDVVTYKRDGTVELYTNGWDTQSTRKFMNACLPYGYGVFKYKNRLHVSVDGVPYIIGNTTMTINLATREVKGYMIPTKQLVDRRSSKEQRAPFQPFVEFMKGYMELLQLDAPKAEDPMEYYGYQRELGEYIRDKQPIPEDKYIQMISVLVHDTYWSSNTRTFEQAKSKLYRMLTEYRTVELPVGSLQGR